MPHALSAVPDPDTRTLSVLAGNYGDTVWREMRRIRQMLYEDQA